MYPYPPDQAGYRAHTHFLNELALSCRIVVRGDKSRFASAVELSMLLVLSQVHIDVQIEEAGFGQHRIVLRVRAHAPPTPSWRSVEILVPEFEAAEIEQ